MFYDGGQAFKAFIKLQGCTQYALARNGVCESEK